MTLSFYFTLIEHLVGSNKIDRKKSAISILNSIFTLNLNEIEVLSSLIEFLHSNQLIKKIEQKIEATILTKINTIFNVGEKRFSLRKFGKFGFDIIKLVTENSIKDYTITEIIIPFLQLKLGALTSKILIITIIAFI